MTIIDLSEMTIIPLTARPSLQDVELLSAAILRRRLFVSRLARNAAFCSFPFS